MEQFKKCSILKDTESHYSGSSEKLDIFPFGEPDRTIKYDGPIIPITEEDKERDKEQIRKYIGMNCQTCTTPTKYPIGFWDGEKGAHGQIFDCHNLECELKLNMLRNVVITEQEKRLVKEANEKHKIFMEQVKVKRKELGITIMKMSQGLGISPSVYSDYEQYRNVVPLDIGDRIEGALSGGNYMNNILKKYGRNRKDGREN